MSEETIKNENIEEKKPQKSFYDYSVPKQYLLYSILVPLGHFVVKYIFHATYVGKENIPSSAKGLIVCSNHIEKKDPILLGMGMKKTCHFIAKEELFSKNALLRWFLTHINAFPIKRGRGDMTALNYSIAIVDKGWNLGIFPEGTRSPDGTPQAGKSGVGLIAKKSGADVLPVSIYKDNETGKTTVRYGKVIKNEEFGFTPDGKSKELKAAVARIMSDITELWEEDSCK